MAPEQIEGLEADARADIFSFGAVLFEMLAGRPPFEGNSRASLLGAILKDDPPPVSRFQPSSSPALDRLVVTCLAKHPDDRWQTARDLHRELKRVAGATRSDLRAGDQVRQTALATRARQPILPWVLAGILATTLAITFILFAPWRPRPDPAPIRFGILGAAGLTLVPNTNDRQFDISPDGARIVYATGPSTSGGPLAIRALGRLEPVRFAGITSARAPFFSPDGEWVGFFDLETVELRKVPSNGGPAVTICRLSAAPRGAVWGPDHTIVFATSDPITGLLSVSAGGGEPVVLTRPDPAQEEAEHFFPSLLSGGRAVVFTVIGRASQGATASVAVLDRATGTRKSLIRNGSNARYVDTGHLVYTAGPTLFALPFDPVRLEPRGAPVPMVEEIGIAPTTGAAGFSVSSSGTLVFMTPSAAISEVRSLVWVDRAGREEPIGAPPRTYYSGRLSPDGIRAVFDIREREDSDAWIWDFPRQTLTRLTFTPGIDFNPLWTPDGREIVTGGTRGLFVRRADGTGTEVRLTSTSEPRAQQFPVSFTPDGKSLLVAETNASVDLALVRLGPAPERAPLIETPFQEIVGEVSPDGRWVAYESNESGRFEVYVRSFPDVASGRWQLSRGGGRKPAWARSGRELFYLDGAGALTVVPIQTTGTFTAGNPTTLFTTRYYSAVQARSYDIASDGRFLMIKDIPPSRNTSSGAGVDIIVVVNWFDELKARVPVN